MRCFDQIGGNDCGRRTAIASSLISGTDGDAKRGKRKGRGKGKGNAKRRGNPRAQAKSRPTTNQQSEARQTGARCCSSGACTPGKGKNLAECCYQGQDLAGKNFSGANLGSAKFSGATLSGANLQGANAGKACFVDADLRGVKTNASTNLGGAISCRTKTDSGENNAGRGQGTAFCPTCDADHPCSERERCEDGRCRRCDVCADGCAFDTVAAAVAGTASGGTIRLCPGTFPTAGVTIAKDLTLLGAGAGADPRSASILDAGERFRVFDIAAGATVTLSRLTIANGRVVGRGVEGGCIHNAGDLTLDRAAVTGCVAASPDLSFGGGIFNRSGGVVLLDRTTITDCSAESGGGIFNESGGAVTLDNSTVADGYTGIDNSGALTLKGATRIVRNNVIGVFSALGTVVCEGAPRVCGNPDDATARAATNCRDVTAASCARVCLGDATPGSGACPA